MLPREEAGPFDLPHGRRDFDGGGLESPVRIFGEPGRPFVDDGPPFLIEVSDEDAAPVVRVDLVPEEGLASLLVRDDPDIGTSDLVEGISEGIPVKQGAFPWIRTSRGNRDAQAARSILTVGFPRRSVWTRTPFRAPLSISSTEEEIASVFFRSPVGNALLSIFFVPSGIVPRLKKRASPSFRRSALPSGHSR